MSAVSFKLVHRLQRRPCLRGWHRLAGRERIRPAALAAAVAMLAMLGTAVPAHAGNSLAGSGNNACDSYLASDDDARLASDSWVLGFLSSANLRARNIDLLANQSNGTIIDALEAYCEAHPDALIADAAVDLLKSLADSAGGECTGPAAAVPERGKLSICYTAGAIDSHPEPAGFSVTVPGVE